MPRLLGPSLPPVYTHRSAVDGLRHQRGRRHIDFAACDVGRCTTNAHRGHDAPALASLRFNFASTPLWERACRKAAAAWLMRDNASVLGKLSPNRRETSVRQVRGEGKAETTYAAQRNPTATSTWKCSGITFPGHGNSGRRGPPGASGNLLKPAETNSDPSTEAPYEPDDCPSGHLG